MVFPTPRLDESFLYVILDLSYVALLVLRQIDFSCIRTGHPIHLYSDCILMP